MKAQKQQRWGQVCVAIMAGVLVLGTSGCENSGGGSSSLADGHDFGPNDPNVMVALGDSITAGSGLDSSSQSYPAQLGAMSGRRVINKGIPGAESFVGADEVHGVLDSYHPGYLLILFGVNDLIMGYNNDIVSELRYMVRAAKDNKTIPVIATMTPTVNSYARLTSGVRRVNADIRTMAAEEGAALVDLEEAFNWDPAYMLPDGLHPGPAGAMLMAQTFFDVVK